MEPLLRQRREALSRELLRQYVDEIVVAFGLCPWAGGAWRGGETRAFFAWDAAFSAAHVAEFGDALDAEPHVQIGFFVMPDFAGRPQSWEKHAEEARRALRARVGTHRAWHVAAFHPGFPADFSSPGQLVSSLRRSPEPFLQLVSVEALAKIARPEAAAHDISAEIAARNFALAEAQAPALAAAFERLTLKSAEARASWRAAEAAAQSR